ncbi:hypothetical protein [Alkalicoccobacillus gibsonii]|uniref:hypothetical protein n=1 Tax=Alkalicoccobacillus gibsonii TaxID=79881 RepID=UPI001932D61E|nr:hypothetical protein [Alkalicoccobacillus gibsonii]MBM0066796.1 hypothetical protein [Alkalicoccobacillus gibsonii]
MVNQNDDLFFTEEIKRLEVDLLYAIDKNLKVEIQKDIQFLETVLINHSKLLTYVSVH